MIESVRDAQLDVEDGTTISSPGMESLDQAADAASAALRHAEAEGARGLAIFGQPVLVSELDAQAQIRELERHLEALKVQIAEREDADMGVDLLQLEDPADGGAGQPPSAPGASGPAWEWPTKDSQWILLKADVTKAHRRIKVLPQDWRFQVAQLDNEWWVNKVGTYGMASAQLYCGRMAALLLRILYYLFPQIDWGFVFVDDFCWLLRLPTGPQFTAALGHTGGFGNAP